ncbi:LysE family translocator [Pararhizobium antarcticum]|uniref:Lysine transporter LysE n=1 Tax=Pararhizobium antarcticum TaxID=1798805 RepID=A0A657LKQ4_9HYPH|nr:LysE family translocator [Pararhizobium antarcticum]OJF90576.1 lysine transporter LysE [Pararhizobium antarcticum]OJF98652.1 lysine transporter LysE [Rhizobium sp. 58]
MSLDYLLTSLIIILLPGTGVLYTLAIGLNNGARASIVAAFGCTLGILPHIFASIAGLSALLHTSALAFEVIKYLGVVYLLYMAWSVLRDRDALRIADDAPPVPSTKIVATAILINSLNPKLSLFFLAFLPQFVPASTSQPTAFMIGLAAVFMLLTFLVFVVYGVFAAAARARVMARPGVVAWMRRGFAAAFGLMGLRLAFSAQ